MAIKRHQHGPFFQMASVVPEGTHGKWAIQHFTVTKDEPQFRAMFHPDEYVEPGTYARLTHNNHVVMSDTRMEQRSNHWAVLDARGDVLIGGLGLGMVLLPVLKKPDVQSVTIIERSPDVVALVVPALMKRLTPAERKKLHVVQADAYDWAPAHKGRQFDFAYFDIWTDICEDNLEDMKRLGRHYQRYMRKGGKIRHWQRALLEYRRGRQPVNFAS